MRVPHKVAREIEALVARMPAFTDAQVTWLEEVFPARCKVPNESLEEHMLYAGKVELVALIRSLSPTGDVPKTPEEAEEALVAELEAEALRQLSTNTPIQET